jgi:very-short-patch-repair endonuclease
MSTVYGIKGEALYREYHGITETPACKCGCGTPTKWRIDRGYGEYANGHNSKGQSNPMYGKLHSKETRHNISQKRKEKFANGEYTFITSEKWSSAAKIVWQRDGYREKMSKLKKDWIKKNGFKCESSDLEKYFSEIVTQHGISLESQYFLDGKFFDFWVPDTKVLVECDGNFYHCHPQTHPIPTYDIQKHNVQNDIIKNQIAEVHGFKLLRFWESDIHERPSWVIQELLTHINSPV